MNLHSAIPVLTVMNFHHGLLTAIQQQLGLKLESQTGPVPLLVIDYVEMPSEN